MIKEKPVAPKKLDDLFKLFKPDPHQLISLEHARKNPCVLDFSDAGTGKTPVALWSYAEQRLLGNAKCALVICPRSLMTNVWVNSVRKFTPHLSAIACTAKNRASAFAEDADIYVTNIDATTWLVKQPASFFKKFTDLIVDESSAYKHHTSQRSKALAKIRKHFERRRIMSGTPASRSVLDVWHQAYIADDGKRLGNSFFGFRNSVCTPRQVGRDARAIRWEDREGAEDAVFALLADITVRHRFEDVVQIPERQVYTVEYDMPTKAKKAYYQMERQQFLAFQEGQKKNLVTAVHAASVRQKLLQIASGAVYVDGSEAGAQTIDDGRYELVMDLACQTPHTLVMFLWKHQRDALVREAEARNLNFAVLDGNSNDTLRDEIEARYQAGQYDVLIAHPQTVAHGLTLTLGTTTIWASPTDNTEWFKQGNRRQARRGQTRSTRVVTVIAEGTVDQAAYDNCTNKGVREDAFLGLFQKYTEEEFA